VDGKTYKLSILDTAGQDEFSAFREVYYRSGDGFILVCSFGDESSLREIKKFHTDVRRIREGKIIRPCLQWGQSIFGTNNSLLVRLKNRFTSQIKKRPTGQIKKRFTSQIKKTVY